MSTPTKSLKDKRAESRTAYHFEFTFRKSSGAAKGHMVFKPRDLDKHPTLVTVTAPVKNGSLGPFLLADITKARVLVIADYRRDKGAPETQEYDSPFSYLDSGEIDIPHFAKDFTFNPAEQTHYDPNTGNGFVSFTLDLLDGGNVQRRDENGKDYHYALTVTVRTRFKDKENNYHDVTFQEDPTEPEVTPR